MQGDDVERRILDCVNARRYDEALALVIDGYGDRILRLAYSFLIDQSDAEDAAQSALIRIWKALPGFRRESALSTWIYAITRNTCLTALKGRRRAAVSLDDPAVRRAVDHLSTPGAPARLPDVEAWIRELPPQYRQVLMLFYMEKHSYDEVARLLDLPLGTVKTYLYRARQSLMAMAKKSTDDTHE